MLDMAATVGGLLVMALLSLFFGEVALRAAREPESLKQTAKFTFGVTLAAGLGIACLRVVFQVIG